MRISSGSTGFQLGPEGIANQMMSGGATTSFTHDPSGLLVSERIGGNSYYYLYDGEDSVIGLVGSSGTLADSYSYDPYGVLRAHTGTVSNPFGYIAGYTDASGLVKLSARFYDPGLGRFTQRDPAGVDPNAYAYGSNNPTNSEDPSGQFDLKLVVDVLELIFDGYSALKALEKFSLSEVVGTFVGAAFDVACGVFVGGSDAATGILGALVATGICVTLSLTAENLTEQAF